MLEIIFIVGLPGSGKTTLAYELMTADTTMIDDFDLHHEELLPEFLNSPSPILLITDPMACLVTPDAIRSRLVDFVGGDFNLTFHAFENDVTACLANCQSRKDGRKIDANFLTFLSQRYNPTMFGVPLPVFKRANPISV